MTRLDGIVWSLQAIGGRAKFAARFVCGNQNFVLYVFLLTRIKPAVRSAARRMEKGMLR